MDPILIGILLFSVFLLFNGRFMLAVILAVIVLFSHKEQTNEKTTKIEVEKTEKVLVNNDIVENLKNKNENIILPQIKENSMEKVEKEMITTLKEQQFHQKIEVWKSMLEFLGLKNSEKDVEEKNNGLLENSDFSIKTLNDGERVIVLNIEVLSQQECKKIGVAFSSYQEINELIVNNFLFKPMLDNEEELDILKAPIPENINKVCIYENNKNKIKIVKYLK